MEILAFSNQKGGVGKTTAALTIGSQLAVVGRRVLLVDLDPQSSLSQCLGITAEGHSLAEALGTNRPGRLTMQEIIQPIRERLDLAPADLALSLTESGLMMRYSREYVLRDALATVASRYDVCLVDCPPSLGILMINAIGAADGVIIPTLPAPADLRGVQMFLTTLEEVQPINPALEVVGFIVGQYESRINSHQHALAALQHAGRRILGTVPKSVRVQESQAARVPLTEYDPAGRVLEAYKEITDEVMQWLKSRKRKTTN